MKLRNERVQAVLSRIVGPDVLHVGCVGEGGEKFVLHSTLCETLAGCEVFGVDISTEGIAELKQRGFKVAVADAESMDLGRQFDTIFAGELIEHLANPGRFLECARRMVKPGGRLVVTTPNPFSVEHVAMYVKNFRRAFNAGHALWLCPQTLEQLARRSGFKQAELVFVDNLWPQLVTSRWSKSFAVLWRIVGPLLPRRFRSTMVAVLQVA
jgi:2-polyprenyl-3-methyl-5-hydroxy-6-metoxy-1,4-benzoquinol methylase